MKCHSRFAAIPLLLLAGLALSAKPNNAKKGPGGQVQDNNDKNDEQTTTTTSTVTTTTTSAENSSDPTPLKKANDAVDGVKVRIGHIGAINVMPKAEEILAICRRELWKEGVLDDTFDVEIINSLGCGESFEGVAVGADMYHQQNVKAFIGPYCNAEMDAVSKMAAFWNVPIIGYMAAGTAFSDKTIYKTTARVSLRTINFMAVATAAALKHYRWRKIDDVNGFDNTILGPFKERVTANGLRLEDLNIENIYGYIHLYDALKLYCLATRKAINETGSLSVINDGLAIWNQMRRMEFPGLISQAGESSGTVLMDDIAERAGVYAAFYVSPVKEESVKVLEMKPFLLTNCDGLVNHSSCMDLRINDTVSGFWPSVNGQLPADEPDCGYRGERCDYTLLMVLGLLAILVVIIALCGFLFCRSMETRALNKTSWRIFRDDFRLITSEEVKSMLSIGSSKTKLSNLTQFAKHHAIIGTNTHASYHMYPQSKMINFCREDLQLLNMMKVAVHDNLNPFLGMSFNEKDEMLIMWKFCSRGTVQDIIYNDEMSLDANFHAAFIRDITLGLEYLHMCPIGYHGSLTPWSCLIDRNWLVKLTDYGIANPIERWTKQGSIREESLLDEDEKSGAIQASNALYCAPEQLQNRESNRRRGVDQNWMKQTQNRRQAGDIYAFGMVMHEILTRRLPFPESQNLTELIAYVKDGSKTVKPQVQASEKINADLIALLQDCWSTNPELRPSIRRVRLNTEHYLKVKGSLVDQMMKMMEQYANNLEKIVKERTGMLEDANERADKLLQQLLPSYVAAELKMGRAVPPKMFKQASVMFTDVVGFTTLCSSSSPLEVVTMLNKVYTGFDTIIAKHGAYKVETIGDAYMIVSGIPQENGTRHLMNISDVALGFMQMLEQFPVPHRPAVNVRIRAGLHTGAVAAGVVGLTTPRYCLFGDTVNMASRMESTGLPQRVQISDDFNTALLDNYPEYETSLRGEVDIKGKGICTTYWLDGIRAA